jgi:azurin
VSAVKEFAADDTPFPADTVCSFPSRSGDHIEYPLYTSTTVQIRRSVMIHTETNTTIQHTITQHGGVMGHPTHVSTQTNYTVK